MKENRDWTSMELYLLKTAWEDKATYPSIGVIARKLFPYRSRNSVIAKASRLKLPSRQEAQRKSINSFVKKVDDRPDKRYAPIPKPTVPDAAPYYKELAVHRPPQTITTSGTPLNLPLIDLPSNGCRFVTREGTKEKLALMCGAAKVPGRPYCEAHLKFVRRVD